MAKKNHGNTEDALVGDLKAQIATLKETCQRKGVQVGKLRGRADQLFTERDNACMDVHDWERKHAERDAAYLNMFVCFEREEEKVEALRSEVKTQRRKLLAHKIIIFLVVLCGLLLIVGIANSANAAERPSQGSSHAVTHHYAIPIGDAVKVYIDGLEYGCVHFNVEVWAFDWVWYSWEATICEDGGFWTRSVYDNLSIRSVQKRWGRIER